MRRSRRRGAGRRIRAVAVLTAVAALVALPGVGPAAAHDTLISTDPADGATGPTAPDAVTLAFNNPPLALGSEVVVTAADGTVVSDGAVQIVDTTATQTLVAERPAGAYTVQWRVTSSDGHPISGTFGFTATEAVGGPSPSASEPAEQPETAAPEETPTATPEATTAPDVPADESGGGASPWLVAGIAAAALLAVLVVVLALRRRGADT